MAATSTWNTADEGYIRTSLASFRPQDDVGVIWAKALFSPIVGFLTCFLDRGNLLDFQYGQLRILPQRFTLHKLLSLHLDGVYPFLIASSREYINFRLPQSLRLRCQRINSTVSLLILIATLQRFHFFIFR